LHDKLPAGNLVGLLLSPLILQRFGWRALFYLFGLAGVPLLLLWFAVVPNNKPRSSSLSSSSSSPASKVGLGQLMSKPATWAIIVANFGECSTQLTAVLILWSRSVRNRC
jgi:predicted MFS family arabinose efflux permease